MLSIFKKKEDEVENTESETNNEVQEETKVVEQPDDNQELQTTFDDEDEFFKACQEDDNVDVVTDVEEDIDGQGATEDEGIGSAYAPRLTAPSATDPNWIHYTAGGYNYCIKIDGNSCIPNCVGYAWGRWRELLNAYHKLSRGNAENWWAYNDGYQRGQTPKVGAVAVWAKGQAGNAADGAGHVAIVEKVNADGSITTSNSGYKSTRFWLSTYKAPYHVGNSYTFLGFIYNPNNYDDPVTPTPTPTPVPTPSDKFNVGDKVVITGDLFTSSNASSANGHVDNKVTTITRKAAGTAHPYNTKGDLGWMNESSISSYVEPTPVPTPEPVVDNTLHVGDSVKIIGTGNGSSHGGSNTAYGIGWTRQVLKIWDGRPFPYQVGNSTGTTGFYKAESLEKK